MFGQDAEHVASHRFHWNLLAFFLAHECNQVVVDCALVELSLLARRSMQHLSLVSEQLVTFLGIRDRLSAQFIQVDDVGASALKLGQAAPNFLRLIEVNGTSLLDAAVFLSRLERQLGHNAQIAFRLLFVWHATW